MLFLYISLTGNTKNFISKLTEHIEKEYKITIPSINIKEIDYNNLSINQPFIAFVPTYLEGGNGIDNGDVEILTTPLRKTIAHQNYTDHLIGVIGSGNKNFNHQYCLTAKQYSTQFKKPVLADFELRGTQDDVVRIADIVMRYYE